MQPETSVPLPTRIAYNFERMKVGDSFFFPDIEAVERCSSAAYSYARSHGNGFKMTRRKVDGGYRIWRIK